MARLKELEAAVAELKEAVTALKQMRFTSDAPVITVEVPVPVLDANGNPTGNVTTGYLQVKLGPTAGQVVMVGKEAVLSMR